MSVSSTSQTRRLLDEVLPVTGPDWVRASRMVNAATRGGAGAAPLLTAAGAEQAWCALVHQRDQAAVRLQEEWGVSTPPRVPRGQRPSRRARTLSATSPSPSPHAPVPARGTKRGGGGRSMPGGKRARHPAGAYKRQVEALDDLPEEAPDPVPTLPAPTPALPSIAVAADGTNALGETTCCVCLTNTREADIILCDSCDREFHKQCLIPPLGVVPVGDWFCGDCLPLAALLRPMCLGGGVGAEQPQWARSTASVVRPAAGGAMQ